MFVASESSPLHGKVIGNKSGLRGPIGRVPCEFPLPIGGADANTAPTNISGKFDIAITIADHEGSPQIKTMLESRATHHAGARLSTVTVRRRRVRAVVDRIDRRTRFGEPPRHQFVHGVYQRFRKVAAADAGLIGDADHAGIRSVESAKCARGTGQNTKTPAL